MELPRWLSLFKTHPGLRKNQVCEVNKIKFLETMKKENHYRLGNQNSSHTSFQKINV